jgi:hypothetical protein
MPSRRTHFISFAAAMVVGCITRPEPAQAPAPVQTMERRLEVVKSKLAHTPDECIVDADCGRTDCCGYGDGCAPERHRADCSDAMCAKRVLAACSCQMGNCVGFFWDPSEAGDASQPRTYYLVE